MSCSAARVVPSAATSSPETSLVCFRDFIQGGFKTLFCSVQDSIEEGKWARLASNMLLVLIDGRSHVDFNYSVCDYADGWSSSRDVPKAVRVHTMQ